MSDYNSKAFFTADGGLERTATESEQDPFKALDELMVVVEALCPKWPERPTFEGTKCFLL